MNHDIKKDLLLLPNDKVDGEITSSKFGKLVGTFEFTNVGFKFIGKIDTPNKEETYD